MKKLSVFFAGIFFLALSLTVTAQVKANPDFFVGKWNVVVAGTPNGDSKLIISLERKEGKLAGAILDSTNKELAKISKIEEKEKSTTVYFTAEGYDVYLLMEKKDDDHITGNLMDMFTAKGDRIKETKTKP